MFQNTPLTVNGASGLTYGYETSLSTVPEISSSADTVFRPPVTPFVLELEDESDLDNLPRLGSSPGPQIPPSSPTEFLPFYSEAATKSAKQQQQKQQPQHLCSTKASGNTPDTEDCSCTSSNSPHLSVKKDFIDNHQHLRHSDNGLETPPPSTLGIPEQICRGVLGSPSSSTESDDSQDRTLTIFESFDPANKDSVPGSLVVANSPSANSELVMQRKSLLRLICLMIVSYCYCKLQCWNFHGDYPATVTKWFNNGEFCIIQPCLQPDLFGPSAYPLCPR